MRDYGYSLYMPSTKAKGHYAAAAYEGIGGLTLRETANAASLLHSLG